MHGKHIVVIGASAGGIEALRTLAAALPPDFPVPICVVLHTAPQAPGILHQIVARAGPLPAVSPSTGMRLRGGHIYVAPPDHHLLIEPGRVFLSKGPRENRFRPAIDPLFRSAAQVYGPLAIGVVLSGGLDDGTAGLWTIKKLGGIAIAQDPDEAQFPEMPRNAIEYVDVDHVVTLNDLAGLLVRLTSKPATAGRDDVVPANVVTEVNIAKEENAREAGVEQLGAPSIYACPECHGVLLQLKEGNRTRFRCHTGHAFSVASLAAAIGEGIEESLWNAVRALEEGSLLISGMAEHLRTSHDGAGADRLVARAEEARLQAEQVRKLVIGREPLPTDS